MVGYRKTAGASETGPAAKAEDFSKGLFLVALPLTPTPLGYGDGSKKNNIKPPRDMYKPSLKITTNTNQFILMLIIEKN